MKLLPDSPLFPTGPEHYKDWAGLDSGSLAAVLAELARSQDHLFVVLAPNSSRAQHLAELFNENFKKYAEVSDDIRNAGPKAE